MSVKIFGLDMNLQNNSGGLGGPPCAAFKKIQGKSLNWTFQTLELFAFVVTNLSRKLKNYGPLNILSISDLLLIPCMAPNLKKREKKVRKEIAKEQKEVVQEVIQAAVTTAAKQPSRQKQARAKVKTQMKGMASGQGPLKRNPWLASLLLPSIYGGASYPDEFGDETARGLTKYEGEITVDAQTGEAVLVFNPTMPDNIVMPAVDAGTAEKFASRSVYKFNDRDSLAGAFDPVTLGPSSTTPVRMPKASPFVLENSSKAIFFNPVTIGTERQAAWVLPEAAGSSTESITLVSYENYMAGPTSVFSVKCYDANGALLSTLSPLVAGTGQFFPAGTVYVVPYVAAGSSSTQNALKNVIFNMNASNDVFPAWVPAQDYDVVSGPDGDGGAVYTSVRCTGLSNLISYIGDVTKEGGQIASAYIQGGQTPADLDLTSFSAVASLPRARVGPLRNGDYSWWKPSETQDMDFRSVNTDNSDGKFPYFVVAIKQTEKSLVVLRTECYASWEGPSLRSFCKPIKSTVDPYQIQAAAVVMQDVPMSMENPIHIKEIGAFLKRMVQRGHEVYTSIKPYIPAMMMGAKVLGTALML